MNGETLDELLRDVPDDYKDRFREIVALTDAFCDARLNDEYKALVRELACHTCQINSPANRGKAASWAAGVTYTIGWVNFLSDPGSEPHMRSAEIASGFGVSESTMQNKSRQIRDALEIMQLDPDWCVPSTLDDNPLVWMVENDGIIFDLRSAPREVQQQAYEHGLIPYIPADRQVKRDTAADVIAKIGPDGVLATGDADAPPGFPGDLLSAGAPPFDAFFGAPRPPAPPTRRRLKSPAPIYTLRIELRYTKPPIWRRVAVPADVTLARLHDIIQAVMDWRDCHLHQFTAKNGARFGSHRMEFVEDLGDYDEDQFRLCDIVQKKGDKFDYGYDFGDSWEHRVTLQRVDPPDPNIEYPVCLAGKLAAPPEDCGGVWGYYDQLAALVNPAESTYDEDELMIAADFDPEAFNLETANSRLRLRLSRSRAPR